LCSSRLSIFPAPFFLPLPSIVSLHPLLLPVNPLVTVFIRLLARPDLSSQAPVRHRELAPDTRPSSQGAETEVTAGQAALKSACPDAPRAVPPQRPRRGKRAPRCVQLISHWANWSRPRSDGLGQAQAQGFPRFKIQELCSGLGRLVYLPGTRAGTGSLRLGHHLHKGLLGGEPFTASSWDDWGGSPLCWQQKRTSREPPFNLGKRFDESRTLSISVSS